MRWLWAIGLGININYTCVSWEVQGYHYTKPSSYPHSQLKLVDTGYIKLKPLLQESSHLIAVQLWEKILEGKLRLGIDPSSICCKIWSFHNKGEKWRWWKIKYIRQNNKYKWIKSSHNKIHIRIHKNNAMPFIEVKQNHWKKCYKWKKRYIKEMKM